MVKRLQAFYAEHGLFWGGLYVLHRLLAVLPGSRSGFFPYHIVAQPFADRANAKAEAVWQLSADDTLIASFPRTSEKIQERLALGHRCYVRSTTKTPFAGYVWIAGTPMQEDEIDATYTFPELRCVWDYDVYVVPQYRLGRTFVSMWSGVEKTLVGEGAELSLSRISAFNHTSLRSHIALGAEKIAWVAAARLMGIQILLTNVKPYLKLSRNRSPEVNLEVRVEKHLAQKS